MSAPGSLERRGPRGQPMLTTRPLRPTEGLRVGEPHGITFHDGYRERQSWSGDGNARGPDDRAAGCGIRLHEGDGRGVPISVNPTSFDDTCPGSVEMTDRSRLQRAPPGSRRLRHRSDRGRVTQAHVSVDGVWRRRPGRRFVERRRKHRDLRIAGRQPGRLLRRRVPPVLRRVLRGHGSRLDRPRLTANDLVCDPL